MNPGHILFYTAVLVLMGIGWGATQPLTKIVVSTGYAPFGLLFWQGVIGAILMGGICLARGMAFPLHARALQLYAVLAVLGAVVPNAIAYQVAVYLPAGIMSLLLSVVPMFAFIVALLLGTDAFRTRRVLGLLFGLIGVLIIIVPSVDLGQKIPVGWAALYLVTAAFYAFEGNYIAKWGTEGLSPFQVMLGASLMTAAMAVPPMLSLGHFVAPAWPLPLPQQALIGTNVIHAFVYAAYVWLAQRAGAVFAVQVSYLVTGFGLLWAWVLLGEAYAPTIWLALGVIFTGMYLVQPRPRLDAPGQQLEI
ncbi:MAG: DMT family transporter [Pseudomonadota bacterium]